MIFFLSSSLGLSIVRYVSVTLPFPLISSFYTFLSIFKLDFCLSTSFAFIFEFYFPIVVFNFIAVKIGSSKKDYKSPLWYMIGKIYFVNRQLREFFHKWFEFCPCSLLVCWNFWREMQSAPKWGNKLIDFSFGLLINAYVCKIQKLYLSC
jgi:hypothetical protein